MSKFIKYPFFLGLALLLGGCVPMPQQPALTPLQIQAMQSRTFHESRSKVFNATANALENMGYTIKNSNAAGGYINVEGSAHSEQVPDDGFNWHGMDVCVGNDNCGQNLDEVTVKPVGNVTVTSAGQGRTVVRLNFTNKQKTSSSRGQSSEDDQQILDPNFYNKIFNQIKQSLFVGSAVN